MLERKLLIGRYLDFIPPATASGQVANGFQTVPAQTIHIAESRSLSRETISTQGAHHEKLINKINFGAKLVKINLASQFHRQQTSGFDVGPSPKLHRNFIWLPWVPGVVTEVAPNGVDILTGPMSGCWITTYSRNHVPYVGHIGTDMNPVNTAAAKAAWNTFAATQSPGTVHGYQPFNNIPGVLPTPGPNDAKPYVFALVTRYAFFSIFAFLQSNSLTRVRIAEVYQLPSSLAGNGQII